MIRRIVATSVGSCRFSTGRMCRQPTRGVAVERAVGAVAVEDLAEAGGELRQPLRGDGAVLDERDRLARRRACRTGAARPRGAGPRAGRASRRRAPGPPRPARRAGPSRRSSSWTRYDTSAGSSELNSTISSAAGRPRTAAIVSFKLPLLPGEVDEHLVHQLDGRRPELQARGQGVERRGRASRTAARAARGASAAATRASSASATTASVPSLPTSRGPGTRSGVRSRRGCRPLHPGSLTVPLRSAAAPRGCTRSPAAGSSASRRSISAAFSRTAASAAR